MAIKATTVLGVAAATYALFKFVEFRNKQWRKPPMRARAIFRKAGFSTKYQKEVELAMETALKCGAAMAGCQRQRAIFKDANAIDPVTQTDQDNEALVTRVINENFPSHKVIGEEDAAAQGRIPLLSMEPTWIVDPIDGTQNFVHGAPLSCVSIGFCDKGEPVIGVIYDPYHDELFCAVKGQGAFMNGDPIAVDDTVDSVQKGLILTDPGYERSPEGIAAMTDAYIKLLQNKVQAFRIIGSSVMSMAWVACGRANAFLIGLHNEGGKPWDYCAGTVIACEAGAVCIRLDDRSFGQTPLSRTGDFDIYSRSCICAGSVELGLEMLEIIQGNRPGKGVVTRKVPPSGKGGASSTSDMKTWSDVFV